MLTLLYGVFVLVFGIYLSAAFADVRMSKKNIGILLACCSVLGALQAGVIWVESVEVLRKLYPLAVHLPMVLIICGIYHKQLPTALVSVFAAYLFCQPAKWFAVFMYSLTGNELVEFIAQSLVLAVTAFVTMRYIAATFARIFGRDLRSSLVFGLVPAVYYLFDYVTMVYTDLGQSNSQVVIEFVTFFLCAVFVLFCFVYYREYERKADAERQAQVIQFTTEHQAKEFETIRQKEQEMRFLRHDMRFFLESILLCLEDGDKEKAQDMIREFTAEVASTVIKRYCENETINYVLSGFAAKYQEQKVEFESLVEIPELTLDEVMFSAILSNALDNALNAQMELPEAQRRVKVMLKYTGRKLLLSVENPYIKEPIFSDGIPVNLRSGHGYGTKSIRYITERLGGNCQFSAKKGTFTLQVVIPLET